MLVKIDNNVKRISHKIALPYLNTHRQAKVSVIIPALNEAENLPYVLPRIPSWVYEVILVDGHSTDSTINVAQQLWPNIRVIVQEGRGKGAALRTGCTAATGDIVVMLDADGSTDPEEIPLFCALLAHADFVKGSRFLQGAETADMPLYRRWGNRGFVLLTNLLFGTRYTDITYGYNATWRYNLAYLALDIDGWASEIISNIRAVRHGLHVVEVPSFEYERIAGKAKLSTLSAGWAILKAIVREYFRELREPKPELFLEKVNFTEGCTTVEGNEA
ncbi:MAG: glycosyltransferase family 2 protein [Chloroflexota bacterium]|nr:glycosyltransferase family 2 protein [Chloroflexota bacterium]